MSLGREGSPADQGRHGVGEDALAFRKIWNISESRSLLKNKKPNQIIADRRLANEGLRERCVQRADEGCHRNGTDIDVVIHKEEPTHGSKVRERVEDSQRFLTSACWACRGQ